MSSRLSALLPVRRGASGTTKPRGRLLRVAGYFAFLGLVSAFFTVRSARAEMAERSLALGRDLMPLADLLGERSALDIDGEIVEVGNSVSNLPLGSILDRFEANCHENGVGDANWRELATAASAHLDAKAFDLGVMRQQKDNEGVVICFPKGESTSSSWMDRVSNFAQTMDLGALGKVRYAFVRGDGSGEFHVLTVFTKDHFRLDKLMVTDDQEPGSDNPDLPRPVRSRRTLSASIQGAPYGVRSYLSMGTSDEVIGAFDKEMESRGFAIVTPPPPEPGQDLRGYLKNGSTVLLGTSKANDGKTLVAIAEMGVDPKVAPQKQEELRIVD